MVKKSHAIKKERGVLGLSDKGIGKAISEKQETEVVEFYEHADNSRMCPGQKEVVKVRDKNSIKIAHQKRLVLLNLKELCCRWKEQHGHNIGFSSFASLRPHWCVLAGASGTHAVCVCKYHQTHGKRMFTTIHK